MKDLTDDQIRSLRAVAEDRQTRIENPADRAFLMAPATVLSLVEEVQRLRHHVTTDRLPAVACPTCRTPHLRVVVGQFDPPNHLFDVWRVVCRNGHRLTPRRGLEFEVGFEALAAKAEAGRGLVETALPVLGRTKVHPDRPDEGLYAVEVTFGQLRAWTAALARWEAANAE